MIKCDTCKGVLGKSSCLIIWRKDAEGVITDIKFVHHFTCDDPDLTASSGAAFGDDWDIEHEISRFKQCYFRPRSLRDQTLDRLDLFAYMEGLKA